MAVYRQQEHIVCSLCRVNLFSGNVTHFSINSRQKVNLAVSVELFAVRFVVSKQISTRFFVVKLGFQSYMFNLMTVGVFVCGVVISNDFQLKVVYV